MITVYCPHCYTANPENSEACAQCGCSLQHEEEKRFVEKLIWALKHPEPTVGPRAAWVLGERREAQAVDALITTVESSEEMALLEEAVVALGKIADPRAVPCLEQSLRQSYLSVRQRAAWALGRIGGPAVIDALKLALEDPNQTVREAALESLSNLSHRAGRSS